MSIFILTKLYYNSSYTGGFDIRS